MFNKIKLCYNKLVKDNDLNKPVIKPRPDQLMIEMSKPPVYQDLPVLRLEYGKEDINAIQKERKD